jgi:hypothetical protein
MEFFPPFRQHIKYNKEEGPGGCDVTRVMTGVGEGTKNVSVEIQLWATYTLHPHCFTIFYPWRKARVNNIISGFCSEKKSI